MKIKPLAGTNLGPLKCCFIIRVARNIETGASIRAAAERKRKGIPVDQCGNRAWYMVDGAAMCVAHAGTMALRHLTGQSTAADPFRPMESAPRDRDIVLRLVSGEEQRAVWWDSWHDPFDKAPPWAWRRIIDGQPDAPVRYGNANGWREVTDED